MQRGGQRARPDQLWDVVEVKLGDLQALLPVELIEGADKNAVRSPASTQYCIDNRRSAVFGGATSAKVAGVGDVPDAREHQLPRTLAAAFTFGARTT